MPNEEARRNAPDDSALDAALRDGLRRLPVPEPSADFDVAIMAALQCPAPWWRRVWPELRPLLAGASCSLAVTLALLAWATQPPGLAPRLSPSAPAPLARPLDMAAVDRLLDRPNLSAASLAEAMAPLAPRRRPAKPRGGRVSSLRPPLIA